MKSAWSGLWGESLSHRYLPLEISPRCLSLSLSLSLSMSLSIYVCIYPCISLCLSLPLCSDTDAQMYACLHDQLLRGLLDLLGTRGIWSLCHVYFWLIGLVESTSKDMLCSTSNKSSCHAELVGLGFSSGCSGARSIMSAKTT